jgi:two-component system CheB/CheR fusion protein
LEGLGQEVGVAYSGERALQIAPEHRPEVAFLGLAMPGMSGRELAEQLRKRFPPEELTLIALSGFGKRSARERIQRGVSLSTTSSSRQRSQR